MSAQYDLNLQDYLRILRRRWKVLAGCCLALGALTLILTPRVRPVYEAGARVKWMFTTDRARTKLARAYPDPTKES